MLYFSIVKIELCQLELLVKVLEDMGYVFDQGECFVCGYCGQIVIVDLVIVVQEGGDIGFCWNSILEFYELVIDFDLWK